MVKIAERKCPICETSECEFLHKQRFVLPEGHPQSAGYDIVCCNGCGFVFADTTVSQNDYDLFYANSSKYQDNKTSTGGGDSPWDAERLERTAARISEYLGDKNSRIIDIGCANGGLLKYLKDQGYNNLHGVDPSFACVENTRNHRISATVGTLSSISSDIGDYDCVILSHVLEHVSKLRGALSVIGGYLKPEGFAYIEVPDASRYDEFVTSPFQDFNTEHINHFSKCALTNLFSMNGWVERGSGQTEFLAAEGSLYPVIYGIFVRGSSQKESLQKDNNLKKKVNKYIQKSSAIMADIDQKIKAILSETDEVIVWGTGQLAMKLLAETSLGRSKIAAFVDGNPINWGKSLCGTQIMAPDQIKSLLLPIIVTSILHGQEIEKMIKYQLNLPNKTILL